MRRTAGLALAIAVTAAAGVAGQLGKRAFPGSIEHPAIGYHTRPLNDRVAALNKRLTDGTSTLTADGKQGYLRALLRALDVPVDSQMLVFAKTSFQAHRIDRQNPRALFFNDTVAVGFVPGGPAIELAAHDPQQGVIFYTLSQVDANPRFALNGHRCLSCHETSAALDVPGMLVRSVFTSPAGAPIYQLGSFVSDHRSAFDQRWGGWYVTGKSGSMQHMGNAVLDVTSRQLMTSHETRNVDSLEGRLEPGAYPSPYSDIVALMVFEHQVAMTNLITRVGWETRYALHEGRGLDAVLNDSVNELVDYLLFVDEAPLPEPIAGSSGFTETFAARGPRDRKGRSLRQLDLKRRLMRYPCSYMIDSAPFDGMPAEAKNAIYLRMWQILSGDEKHRRYDRLTRADRQAVAEILQETKSDFRSVTRPSRAPAPTPSSPRAAPSR